MIKVYDFTKESGKVIPLSTYLLSEGGITDTSYEQSSGYHEKELWEVRIFNAEIHFIYRQYPMANISQTGFLGFSQPIQPRVFKEIWSAVDGQFKCINVIEGKYIPYQQESFEF
jgi:hypothetical protein